jgi:hypothetical protein
MRFGRLCEGATYKLTGTAISKDGKTMTLASKGTNAEGLRVHHGLRPEVASAFSSPETRRK